MTQEPVILISTRKFTTKLGYIESKPAKYIAIFADGSWVNILGIVELELIFNNKKLKTKFRVLSKLESNLLFGLDILNASGYQIKYEDIPALNDLKFNKIGID